MMITSSQATKMFQIEKHRNTQPPYGNLQSQSYLIGFVVESGAAIFGKWHDGNHVDKSKLSSGVLEMLYFILSQMLRLANNDPGIAAELLVSKIASDGAKVIFDGKTYFVFRMSVLERIELITGLSVVRRVEMGLFSSLLHDSGMDWEELYRRYTSRHTMQNSLGDKPLQMLVATTASDQAYMTVGADDGAINNEVQGN